MVGIREKCYRFDGKLDEIVYLGLGRCGNRRQRRLKLKYVGVVLGGHSLQLLHRILFNVGDMAAPQTNLQVLVGDEEDLKKLGGLTWRGHSWPWTLKVGM